MPRHLMVKRGNSSPEKSYLNSIPDKNDIIDNIMTNASSSSPKMMAASEEKLPKLGATSSRSTLVLADIKNTERAIKSHPNNGTASPDINYEAIRDVASSPSKSRGQRAGVSSYGIVGVKKNLLFRSRFGMSPSKYQSTMNRVRTLSSPSKSPAKTAQRPLLTTQTNVAEPQPACKEETGKEEQQTKSILSHPCAVDLSKTIQISCSPPKATAAHRNGQDSTSPNCQPHYSPISSASELSSPTEATESGSAASLSGPEEGSTGSDVTHYSVRTPVGSDSCTKLTLVRQPREKPLNLKAIPETVCEVKVETCQPTLERDISSTDSPVDMTIRKQPGCVRSVVYMNPLFVGNTNNRSSPQKRLRDLTNSPTSPPRTHNHRLQYPKGSRLHHEELDKENIPPNLCSIKYPPRTQSASSMSQITSDSGTVQSQVINEDRRRLTAARRLLNTSRPRTAPPVVDTSDQLRSDSESDVFKPNIVFALGLKTSIDSAESKERSKSTDVPDVKTKLEPDSDVDDASTDVKDDGASPLTGAYGTWQTEYSRPPDSLSMTYLNQRPILLAQIQHPSTTNHHPTMINHHPTTTNHHPTMISQHMAPPGYHHIAPLAPTGSHMYDHRLQSHSVVLDGSNRASWHGYPPMHAPHYPTYPTIPLAVPPTVSEIRRPLPVYDASPKKQNQQNTYDAENSTAIQNVARALSIGDSYGNHLTPRDTLTAQRPPLRLYGAFSSHTDVKQERPRITAALDEGHEGKDENRSTTPALSVPDSVYNNPPPTVQVDVVGLENDDSHENSPIDGEDNGTRMPHEDSERKLLQYTASNVDSGIIPDMSGNSTVDVSKGPISRSDVITPPAGNDEIKKESTTRTPEHEREQPGEFVTPAPPRRPVLLAPIGASTPMFDEKLWRPWNGVLKEEIIASESLANFEVPSMSRSQKPQKRNFSIETMLSPVVPSPSKRRKDWRKPQSNSFSVDSMLSDENHGQGTSQPIDHYPSSENPSRTSPTFYPNGSMQATSCISYAPPAAGYTAGYPTNFVSFYDGRNNHFPMHGDHMRSHQHPAGDPRLSNQYPMPMITTQPLQPNFAHNSSNPYNRGHYFGPYPPQVYNRSGAPIPATCTSSQNEVLDLSESGRKRTQREPDLNYSQSQESSTPSSSNKHHHSKKNQKPPRQALTPASNSKVQPSNLQPIKGVVLGTPPPGSRPASAFIHTKKTVSKSALNAAKKRQSRADEGQAKKRDRPPMFGEEDMQTLQVIFYDCPERDRFCNENHEFKVPKVPDSRSEQVELRDALGRLFKRSNLPPVPSALLYNVHALAYYPFMQHLFHLYMNMNVDIYNFKFGAYGQAFENPRLVQQGESAFNAQLDSMCYVDGEDNLLHCLVLRHIDNGARCDHVASELGKMRRHAKNHYPEKKWVCCFCRAQMPDLTDMERHTSTHTSLKPFRCVDCNKFFSQKVTLSNHMEQHHNTKLEKMDPRKSFTCRQDGCLFQVHERDECILHLKNHHADDEYIRRYKRGMWPFSPRKGKTSTSSTDDNTTPARSSTSSSDYSDPMDE